MWILDRRRAPTLLLAALTMAASGWVLADTVTSPAATPSVSAPLDLKAPPVEHVLSSTEVRSLLDAPDADDAQAPEDVRVESEHYRAPVPYGFFRAVPWAIMHPLQAWRIFTPITD
jgi:hypothetical protein